MEVYRGYQISYCPPPIPDRRFDWSWVSENYDAEFVDDAWHGNGLAGHSVSLEEAKRDIDEQIGELTCEEFDCGGVRWIIWESAPDLWRAEIQANYFADDHSAFIEAASAEECRAEIHEINAIGRA